MYLWETANAPLHLFIFLVKMTSVAKIGLEGADA